MFLWENPCPYPREPKLYPDLDHMAKYLVVVLGFRDWYTEFQGYCIFIVGIFSLISTSWDFANMCYSIIQTNLRLFSKESYRNLNRSPTHINLCITSETVICLTKAVKLQQQSSSLVIGRASLRTQGREFRLQLLTAPSTHSLDLVDMWQEGMTFRVLLIFLHFEVQSILLLCHISKKKIILRIWR